MTPLITIDPGETSGWASFEDGVLVAAGSTRGVVLPGTEGLDGPFKAVVEKPHTFPSSPAKGDDIITLAVTAGRWVEYLIALGGDVEMVWPQTWKGSVPKNVQNKRTLDLLTEGEKALLPKRPRAKNYDHNMLDAVGIGLWKLERTRR